MEKENWFLWKDSARSPFVNMGIDEALLRRMPEMKKPLLRFYSWDRPSVSIGYTQHYNAAPQTAYTIVRRLTGGGVVFHDNDLTYTVLIPAGHGIHSLDRMESYRIFHRAMVNVFDGIGIESKLAPKEDKESIDWKTMQCFQSPVFFDVIAEKEKLAGAAQRRSKNGILHQGSISLESVRISRDELIDRISTGFIHDFGIDFIPFTPDPELFDEATALVEKKYSKDKWNKEKEI